MTTLVKDRLISALLIAVCFVGWCLVMTMIGQMGGR
jgi:hypothetical protein